MTVSGFEIYVIGVLGKIAMLLLITGVACSILFLIGWFQRGELNWSTGRISKPPYILGAVAVILLFIAAFTPSSKHAAAIIMIPAILNNEHIQNTGGDMLVGTEAWAKEWAADQLKKKEEANHD